MTPLPNCRAKYKVLRMHQFSSIFQFLHCHQSQSRITDAFARLLNSKKWFSTNTYDHFPTMQECIVTISCFAVSIYPSDAVTFTISPSRKSSFN